MLDKIMFNVDGEKRSLLDVCRANKGTYHYILFKSGEICVYHVAQFIDDKLLIMVDENNTALSFKDYDAAKKFTDRCDGTENYDILEFVRHIGKKMPNEQQSN